MASQHYNFRTINLNKKCVIICIITYRNWVIRSNSHWFEPSSKAWGVTHSIKAIYLKKKKKKTKMLHRVSNDCLAILILVLDFSRFDQFQFKRTAYTAGRSLKPQGSELHTSVSISLFSQNNLQFKGLICMTSDPSHPPGPQNNQPPQRLQSK